MLNDYKKELQRLTNNETYLSINELPNFSYNIKYETSPEKININNKYLCSPDHPRICKLNDSTSCIGCQNLTASCVSIPNDISFIDIHGNKGFLKKNNEGEGYCLDILTPNQKCNPYHGELVIVMLDYYTSALFCSCKNPGYIGNLRIDGACDVPFICDGMIDNINQPLSKIKCKCPKHQVSKTITDKYGNIYSICMKKTIMEMTDEDVKELLKDSQFTEDDLIPIEKLNPTFAERLQVTKVLNPCRIDFFTGMRIQGELESSYDDKDTYECTSNLIYIVPIRMWDKSERYLKGPNGPDGVMLFEPSAIFNLGNVPSKGLKDRPSIITLATRNLSNIPQKFQDAFSEVYGKMIKVDGDKIIPEQLTKFNNERLYFTLNATDFEYIYPMTLKYTYIKPQRVGTVSCNITWTSVWCKFASYTFPDPFDIIVIPDQFKAIEYILSGSYWRSVCDRLIPINAPFKDFTLNKPLAIIIMAESKYDYSISSIGDKGLGEFFWKLSAFSSTTAVKEKRWDGVLTMAVGKCNSNTTYCRINPVASVVKIDKKSVSNIKLLSIDRLPENDAKGCNEFLANIKYFAPESI